MTRAGAILSFETEVLRVRRVSPTYVRVTFTGDRLDDLDDGGALGPRDQRIKLMVPPTGGAPGQMRTCSIRALRHRELDVDVVLHGATGLASDWASTVRPGDRITILGPQRRHAERYGGIEWAPPPAPCRVLLVGDETAAPAIGSILATLPTGYVGDALLEVPVAADVQELFTESGVLTTWLPRGALPHGERLLGAVRDVTGSWGSAPGEVDDVDPDGLIWETPGRSAPAGSPYAWVAGEADLVRDLRRHLLGEVGVPRESVAFMGYWRRGRGA